MAIPEEALATADSLSGLARRFLDYAEADPECRRPIDRSTADLPPWMAGFPYPLQAWPTFVGGKKIEEIRRATVEMPRLVKSVLDRIFKGDVQKISDFYGIGSKEITELLLTPPTGVDAGLARCDFIDTREGLKCLEVNMGGHLGGWELHFWEQVYRKSPPISRFLAAQGIYPSFQDPFRSLFEHLVDQALRNDMCGNGRFNTLLVLTEHLPSFGSNSSRYMNDLYSSILRPHGLEGKILFDIYPTRFSANRGMLSNEQGDQIQAVVEHTDLTTPPQVYRCFKAGSLSLYNGPLGSGRILGDKRNLALLSEHQDSDIFDSAERSILENHLPWSRLLVRGETTYQGDRVDLEELLSRRREDFVMKLGVAARGEGVIIGRTTPIEQWNANVREGMAQGGWMVQQHVSSRPFLYQHEESYRLHDVVWGMFSCGATYGGGFLRMIPTGQGEGVINSSRGASDGLILEV